MIARITNIAGLTCSTSSPTFRAQINATLGGFLSAPGCQGALALSDPLGAQFLALSLWEDEAALAESWVAHKVAITAVASAIAGTDAVSTIDVYDVIACAFSPLARVDVATKV